MALGPSTVPKGPQAPWCIWRIALEKLRSFQPLSTLTSDPFIAKAYDDFASTDESTAITIDVLANDLGTGTFILDVPEFSDYGVELIWNPDDTITYVPNGDFDRYSLFGRRSRKAMLASSTAKIVF